MVTEAEVSAYIKQAHAGSNMPRPPWSRSVYRELLEAGQRHRTGIAAEAQELKQLRRKVAELERFMQNGLLEAVGTELGNMYRQLEDRINVVENRDPVPIALPILEQEGRPVMRYAGLWDNRKSYEAGDLITYNGGAWVSLINSQGLRPGDGVAWKLAIKSDLAQLRRTVREEVQRQLASRNGRP
jgi:hypothetical protein